MLTTGPLGHTFRIAGRVMFIGWAVPLRGGTTVAVVAQIGSLVLPRWFVEQEDIKGGSVFEAKR